MLTATAHGAAPTPRPVDPSFDRYASPARIVNLPNGRTLNLDCRGSGAPTVLLFAGLNAWSEVWLKVHDKLAEHHRVCAFDPAGFGFSGPSPEPQDAAHIVADVEAALKTAGIAGPYIVVGHSAGGLQAVSFADRHQRETAGMVLVDPSYPGLFADFERIAPNLSRFFYGGNDRKKAAYQHCAETLATGPISPTATDASTCLIYRQEYSEKLRTALAAIETPARLSTKTSQIDGFAAASRDTVNPNRNYAAMPLIVLTRGNLGTPPGPPPPGMPAEATTEGPASDRAWAAGHEALVKLSTHGEHRIVVDSGHMIQFEKPEAVIDAINAVAAEALR
ncbi:hypothetical protein GCM10011396_10180 [Undibacterium terreum]|uniref:AB hydrolase-1 domain-containing protein n=2 Tax=Undibacterium terreum TaxID=1224302 RepID=A0A916UB03_9BURK|nr:hypothetical protein GCM10011396_10180 [Undibacterium terreum]